MIRIIAALAVAGFVMNLVSDEQGTAFAAIDRALSLNPASATTLYLAAQAHGMAAHGTMATSLATRLAAVTVDTLARRRSTTA